MKKAFPLLILAFCAIILSACGGNYSRHQNPEQKNLPMDCTGLHVKNATWHFTDEFGQTIDVVGTCKKGMRAGNFDVSFKGSRIAITKFKRDVEQKTTCFVGNKKTRTSLDNCLRANAQVNMLDITPSGKTVYNVEIEPDDDESEE